MKQICQKILGVTIIIVLVMSFHQSFAVTQSEINSQKNQQTQNKNKINDAEKKKDEIEAEKSEVQKEVETLSTQINSYEDQIDELDSKINDANNKINDAENRIAQAQNNYDKKQEILEKRIVAVYEAGETSYLDVLLNSQSVTEFISKYYIVSEVAEHDVELLEEIQKQKQEIETAKHDLENSKQELTTARSSKTSVANELKSAKSQKDAKVAQLSEEEKKVEAEIQELQVANRQLANQIKEAERKYAEQLAALNKPSSGSGGSTPVTGSGYLMRPINGGSISANGYYPSGKFHGAIDYAVAEGTPVYAAADGVVMLTANLTSSYGTHVVIRHANGLQTYYAHGTRGSICVSSGQIVKKGQQIMRSGNTGNSSGPHLHFEVRVSPYNYNGYAKAYGQDSRVNPNNYM